MGKNSWLRIQLGLKNLSEVRSKLGIHLITMHALFSGMGLASLGRLENEVGGLRDNVGGIREDVNRFLSLFPQLSGAEGSGSNASTAHGAHEEGLREWHQMMGEILHCGEQLNVDSNNLEELQILGPPPPKRPYSDN